MTRLDDRMTRRAADATITTAANKFAPLAPDAREPAMV
jgi:hypothetical protein